MKTNKSYTKIIIVAFLYLSVRLLFSCVPQNPIEFNYNSIYLKGVDNSGQFLIENTDIDTLYADAVAINLKLTDSTLNYYGANTNLFMELKNALSFKKAYATSLPPPAYYSNKLVKSIKVFTVFDLNQDIKAGDLLNECVVFSFGNDFGLYKNHQEACKHFNTTNYEPSNSVTIILKSSVANTHAQFRVEVLFDDCTKLSDTTSVFNIIPSVK